jgi:DNA-binding transcriptional ArsR family regulator
MTEKKLREISPAKLKVDEKKKYIINLPNGEKIAIDLTSKEIETIENWIHLLGKHNLRFEIINILLIFNELNITQISHMVEQSKSTVARHLKLMENDGFVISRKAVKYQKGKIPPKLYQINKKIIQIIENAPVNIEPPTDPIKLGEFYKKEINSYRVVNQMFKTLLDLLNPLLDTFEEQLNDIPGAKETYEKFFSFQSKLSPHNNIAYFSEKYYDEFMEIYLDFAQKIIELLTIQNNDPEIKERAYVAIISILPIKTLYEVIEKKIRDKL